MHISVLCPFLNPNWLGHVSRNISHLSKIADSNNLDIIVASAMGLRVYKDDDYIAFLLRNKSILILIFIYQLK